MTQFKRAVKNGTTLPDFPREDGHRYLPEWEVWVKGQGRRVLLKQNVIQRGGQVRDHDDI